MSPNRWTLKFWTAVAAVATLAGLTVLMSGQEDPKPITDRKVQNTGLVDDWSFHHLVFSNPGTAVDALAQGRFEQWYRITNDPRYQLQQLKRSFTQRAVAAAPDFAARTAQMSLGIRRPKRPVPTPEEPVKKDWSAGLGSGAAATLTATISATINSSTVSSSSTLTIDAQTLTASAPVAEVGTLTEGATYPPTSTLVIGTISYDFSSSTLGTTPAAGHCNVYTDTSKGTVIDDLYGAISNNGGSGGGNSTTTWECASGATPNGTVTAVLTGDNPGHGYIITLTAVTAGLTGVTPTLGTTGFTWAPTTAGSDGTTSATTFVYWAGATYATQSQLATNIAAALNDNSTITGLFTIAANSPSPGDVVVTAKTAGAGGNSYSLTPALFSAFTGGSLTGGTTATVQPNACPAKYGASLTTASCSGDFVVYPTGLVGASGAANIIAYNELYGTSGPSGTGCGAGTSGGAVPSVYWAYNTGAGAVTTSPTISIDGTEVAFVQSNGTTASLVVLKWAASTTETLTSPDTLTASSNITTCTAPCMTVTSLSHNDTYSTPFYDYWDDALYVGDDSGNLEKFTPVLRGAISGPTVLSLNTAPYAISSPVYDATSGCVFVGDTYGYLYSVDSGTSTTASVCKTGIYAKHETSENLGNGSANEGIFDAPLVDSTAGTVYAFITDSAAITATGTCAAGSNCVAEFATSFGSGAAPSHVEPLGTGGATYNLYAGVFDNVYYSSSAPTGSLYAIGNTGVTTGATLYRVTITTGAIAGVTPAVSGLTTSATGAYPWPSPLPSSATTAQARASPAVRRPHPAQTIFSSASTEGLLLVVPAALETAAFCPIISAQRHPPKPAAA